MNENNTRAVVNAAHALVCASKSDFAPSDSVSVAINALCDEGNMSILQAPAADTPPEALQHMREALNHLWEAHYELDAAEARARVAEMDARV